MDTAQGSPVKTLCQCRFSIGVPLLLVALNSTPVGLEFVFVIIGFPVLFGLWACLGIWTLVLTVRHMRRREWISVLANDCSMSANCPMVTFLTVKLVIVATYDDHGRSGQNFAGRDRLSRLLRMLNKAARTLQATPIKRRPLPAWRGWKTTSPA